VPQLTEALSLLEDGVFSSLQANNLQALVDYTGADEGAAAVQLLADPQTAGGMLAGIPADRVTECLMRLNEAGYTQAAVIGSVTAAGLRLLD
jgi:selenide,water dikinase